MTTPKSAEELEARCAEMEHALDLALRWMGPPGEDDTTAFERIADWFRRDTGYLRPGKDSPAALSHDQEERRKAWDIWCDTMSRVVRESMQSALSPTSGPDFVSRVRARERAACLSVATALDDGSSVAQRFIDAIRELDSDGHITACGNGGADSEDCSPECIRVRRAKEGAAAIRGLK